MQCIKLCKVLLLTKNRKAICALPILVLFNFLELRRPTCPLMHRYCCVHRSATDLQHHTSARRTTFYSSTPNLCCCSAQLQKVHPPHLTTNTKASFHWRETMLERSNRFMHLLLIKGITDALQLEKTAKIISCSHQGRPPASPALSFPHHACCCGTTAILPQRIGP